MREDKRPCDAKRDGASNGQPEVAGEYARFAQALLATHLIKVVASRVGGLINRQRGAIRQRLAPDEAEQMIHRIEFRAGARQEAKSNAKPLRQLYAIFRRMWRATILKEDNAPTSPM